MQLANIELGKLAISALNMRHGKKAPDVADILPSIRKRGVLVPLLVRPAAEPGAFEIIAGRRRWFAASTVVAEGGEIDPLPCAVLTEGDDASAIEASLLENIARLDPDEASRWATFSRLVKAGRSVENISQTFGVTDLYVRRVLALGNLLPRIRSLYADEAIDAVTVRQLTLATKSQQQAWLKLWDDPDGHAPTGAALKAWLFGGQSIATRHALFPVDQYKGRIVADLFGEDSYFDDSEAFWAAQNEAVAGRRDVLLDQGWIGVEVMEAGARFYTWEHEKTAKKAGGRVYIEVAHSGEVVVHEGWLDRRTAQKARVAKAKAEAGAVEKPVRAEVTSAQQRYIDLHRHAAVRAALTDHPGVALRLLLAHAVTSSGLWQVKPETQDARVAGLKESLETNTGETVFAARRDEALALLDASPNSLAVVGGAGRSDLARLFVRLLGLGDAQVFAVAAVLMGETLEAGSSAVEAAGTYLKVDMADYWSPDALFFDLIRDRQVANAMLKEVGGKRVADGNLTEKVSTQKGIVRDFLDGANNRPKVEGWTPRWLAFPVAAYTDRSFPTLTTWGRVKPALKSAPKTEPQSLPIAAE